jgi:hypothetical protein
LIASCQLIAVPVPCRIVQQLDQGFVIDNSFVVRAPFGGDQKDKVYETGGIFLPRWLLTHKLGRNRFEELTSYYEQAVAAASEIPGFGTVHQSEREFIPRLMAALAEGLPPGIFPGRSRNIAVELFARHQVFFRTLQCGADLPSQLAWARTYSELHLWKEAVPLYDSLLRLYQGAYNDYSSERQIEYTVKIVRGIRDCPDRSLIEAVIATLDSQQILARIASDTQLKESYGRAVVQMYLETLERIRRPEVVLAEWDRWLKGKIEPDSSLYLLRGRLCEDSNKLSLAADAFQQAINTALLKTRERAFARTKLATFASQHPGALKQDADELFREAEAATQEAREPTVALLPAWAKHRREQAVSCIDRTQSRVLFLQAAKLLARATRECRNIGVIDRYVWTGMADLFYAAWQRWGRPSYLRAATRRLRAVIGDEYGDWRGKVGASSRLGQFLTQTCNSSYRGKSLDEVSRGLSLLEEMFQDAFESPGGLRDDPETMTQHDAYTHCHLSKAYDQFRKIYISDLPRQENRKIGEAKAKWLDEQERHARLGLQGLTRYAASLSDRRDIS